MFSKLSVAALLAASVVAQPTLNIVQTCVPLFRRAPERTTNDANDQRIAPSPPTFRAHLPL